MAHIVRASKSRESLLRAVENLHDNSRFSDFYITCGTHTWNVHKVIVCVQSEYFAKACKGDFEESRTNSITLEDDDEDAVAGMIEFFYRGEYYPDFGCTNDEENVALHIKVFVIADKYLVNSLRKLAMRKVGYFFYMKWDTEVVAKGIALIYSLDDVHKKRLKWTVTARLRQQPELIADEDQALNKVLSSCHEFWKDAARSIASTLTSWEVYSCSQCCEDFRLQGDVPDVLRCPVCGSENNARSDSE